MTDTERLRMYTDRRAAGRELAHALHGFSGRRDVVVLALPRGGVPVAFEVARALAAVFDLMLVRKLGAPGHEELAMGAIASGGATVLNSDVIASLGISEEAVARAVARETRELLRRDHAYRGARPSPPIRGRCVILVDDGLATGASMEAAVAAVRKYHPKRVVVAVPVAPDTAVARMRAVADEVVCLEMPEAFYAVGQWYMDFTQVEDAEVRALLAQAWAAS